MTRYAENTDVSPDKSRLEIEALFRKHGATRVATDMDVDRGVVVARIGDRYYRFEIKRPTSEELLERAKKEGRRLYTKSQNAEAIEHEWARRWRVLLLVSKAKLELVAGGERTLEQEFMADLVLPSGSTFGEWAAPALRKAFSEGGWEPPKLGSGGT